MHNRQRMPYKFDVQMQQVVIHALEQQYSPEQITERRKKEGQPAVSHERIYQLVYQNKSDSGVLYKNLPTINRLLNTQHLIFSLHIRIVVGSVDSMKNTNGLIRQYFPKSTDFAAISDDDDAFVQQWLNTRPRKTLNFDSLIEFFNNSQNHSPVASHT
jgi:IS30 family transposase